MSMADEKMTALLQAASCEKSGEFEEARRRYRQLAEREPDFHVAHYFYGCFLLKMGEWPAAWPYFERRVFTDPYLSQGYFLLGGQFWTGQEVPPASRLHLIGDMGYGDLIMAARFIPRIAERFSSIVFTVPRGLGDLFTGIHPKVSVTDAGGHPTNVDLRAFAMSLPAILGTTPESVDAAPYLRPDDERVRRWAARLPPGGGLRVGLAWAGNPANANDAERSLPADRLAPLLAVPGVRFCSLHKVVAPGDAAAFARLGAVVTDLTPDFADTAAIMAHLDLVISVDTAAAHLAGALGRPTWIAVPFASDWRWLVGREDSVWYASARLFRQERRGDWTPVMARMAAALAALA